MIWLLLITGIVRIIIADYWYCWPLLTTVINRLIYIYIIYYWSISFIVAFFSFFKHKMPNCVNFAKGQTKLNEGRYCKTCFAQVKNISGNQELVIENELNDDTVKSVTKLSELINRSSISDHSIWPSPTQSPVHKSQMEISEKEKEKCNISQDALQFESTNDDHENKLITLELLII